MPSITGRENYFASSLLHTNFTEMEKKVLVSGIKIWKEEFVE
jgi:hypothetical protein